MKKLDNYKAQNQHIKLRYQNNNGKLIDNSGSCFQNNEEYVDDGQHRFQQIALNNTNDHFDLDRVNLRQESTLRTEIIHDSVEEGAQYVQIDLNGSSNNKQNFQFQQKDDKQSNQQMMLQTFNDYYNQQFLTNQNINQNTLQTALVDINLNDQEQQERRQQLFSKKSDTLKQNIKKEGTGEFKIIVSNNQKYLQSNGQSYSQYDDNSNVNQEFEKNQRHQATRKYNFCNPQSLQNIPDNSLGEQRSNKGVINNIKSRQRISNVTLNYFDRIKIMAQIKPKIKKFFENKTIFGMTRQLNNVIRNYINDSSDYHVDKKIGSNFFLSIFKSFLYKLYLFSQLYKLPLFDPESRIKVFFNSIIVTYNCFYLFIISLKVFFQADFGHNEEILNIIAITAWIIEMVMEMNTAMYHNHLFVTDRKIIMKIYFKEYFFYEILPLIFEGRSSDNIYMNIFLQLPLLLKIKGMMINLEKLEFYILQLINKQHFFLLFKLIMQMLLLGHIVACLWNCIAYIEVNMLNKEYTWYQASHIIDGDWWKTYLYAQYWAFTTMKNIGTTPNTEAELVFTSICMILSCIAFGYLLNAIGNIIQDMAQKEENYKKDLSILNSYMKRREINLGLKRRVNIELKKFYEQQSKEQFSAEKEIIGKLSQNMSNEIQVQSSKKILQNFPFFYKLFSDQTIMKLYGIMEEVILAPSQIVFDQNNYIDESYSVYLIVQGSVLYYAETLAEHEEENYNLQTLPTIYQEKSMKDLKQNIYPVPNRHNHHYKKKVKVLTKGQSFGIVGFFTGKQRVLNVQSNGYSTVMKIERNKFLKILEENKNDYEKFMEVKDKLLFEGVFEDLNLFCYICNSKEHLSNACCKVHFDKKNQHIIYRFNHSAFQQRKPYERQRLKSKQTLFERSQVSKAVQNIREENSFLDLTQNIDEAGQESFCDTSLQLGDISPNNQPLRLYSANQQDEIASSNNIQLINNNQSVNNNEYQSKTKILSNDEENNQFEQCESELIQAVNTQINQARLSTYQNQDTINDIQQKMQKQNENHKVLRPAKFSERDIIYTDKEDISEEGNNDMFDQSRRLSELHKQHLISSQKKINVSPRKKKTSSLIFEDSFILGDQKKIHQQKDSLNNFVKNIVCSIQEQLFYAGSNQQFTLQNQQNRIQFSDMVSMSDNKQEQDNKYRVAKKSKHYPNNNKTTEQINQKSQQNMANGIQQNNFGSNNNIPNGQIFNQFEKMKTLGMNLNRFGTNQSFRNMLFLQHQQAIQESQSFIYNLDVMKNYSFYFPQYNCLEVIKRHNAALFKLQKKRKIEKNRQKTQIDIRKLKNKNSNRIDAFNIS
ncbi:hypothetical protein ABPG72_018286 [Tetrahymena utriculariae]